MGRAVRFSVSLLLVVFVICMRSLPTPAARGPHQLLLRTATLEIDGLSFLENLSGEIHIEGSRTLLRQSFTLAGGQGSLEGELIRRGEARLRLWAENVRPRGTFEGCFALDGRVSGPAAERRILFTGRGSDIRLNLSGVAGTAPVWLAAAELSAEVCLGTEETLLEARAGGDHLELQLQGRLPRPPSPPAAFIGHGRILLRNIDLSAAPRDRLDLGGHLDRLDLELIGSGETLAVRLVLAAPFAQASGSVWLDRQDRLSGQIRVQARREAVGRRLALPWLHFLVQPQLEARLELGGTRQEPRLLGIDWGGKNGTSTPQ